MNNYRTLGINQFTRVVLLNFSWYRYIINDVEYLNIAG
jgi:hypothetical protein